MNCCNSYGKCTQGADCAIRGCSQSKGRDNVVNWVNSVNTPIQYLPKIDAPPMGYFQDFCEFFLSTLLPWTIGVAVGAVGLAWYLL